MELTGALEAARARCSPAWHPSTSQPTVPDRWSASTQHGSRRVFLWRKDGALRKNEAVLCSRSSHSAVVAPRVPAAPGGALRPRRGPVFRARAQPAKAEIVDDGEIPKSDSDSEQKERVISYEEEFGVDADGNLTASLPEEFLELMKDEGPAPNYWLAGFGLVVAFLARKAIWKELTNWGKVALAGGILAVEVVKDTVELVLKQLVVWGGDPLANVILVLAYVVLTINNFFRFIAEIVPPLPVLFAITLASIVLLVGESVSDTYSSSEKEFPSRRVLDTAGLLGLGGFIGVIPVEITLLGIIAITVFLLFVRKVNPVAGFTPAAAVFAAVAEPIIRYSVLVCFIGSSLYRYWKLGYLSSGAVQKERTSEYPRILIAMLYLVAVAFGARVFFFTIDGIRVLFSAATV